MGVVRLACRRWPMVLKARLNNATLIAIAEIAVLVRLLPLVRCACHRFFSGDRVQFRQLALVSLV
jgi:hypothetical protein